MKVKLLSRVQLLAAPWTLAYQAPLSIEFSRQEHWSGLPFPSPGDLPNPGIEPGSPTLRADTLPSEPPRNWPEYKPVNKVYSCNLSMYFYQSLNFTVFLMTVSLLTIWINIVTELHSQFTELHSNSEWSQLLFEHHKRAKSILQTCHVTCHHISQIQRTAGCVCSYILWWSLDIFLYIPSM